MRRAWLLVLVPLGLITAPVLILSMLAGPPPGPSVIGMLGSKNVSSTVTSCTAPLLTKVKIPSGVLTRDRVVQIAEAVGWRGEDVAIAVAVAKAESKWNPRAVNDKNRNGSTDYGLFQINSIHQSILASGTWSDPMDNARMAYKVWTGSGRKWTPWVTFNNGMYRPFLQPVKNAPVQDCTPEAPDVTGSCTVQSKAVYATYRNGRIPKSGLCTLKFDTRHKLRADAANALVQLNTKYKARFGRNLCMTDSYRSYEAQVDVRRRKGPGMTADPGTSNHGWGLATDLCGPGGGHWVSGSDYDRWFHLHGPKHGWVHPEWARPGGSRPEAWHHEFVDGTHRP